MSDPKDRSSHSSQSWQPDPLLERLLGGIARALDGLVEGNQELRKAFAELQKNVLQHLSRHEGRITDFQVAIDEFINRVEAVVEHQKSVVGATVTARDELTKSKRALDDSKEVLNEAVKKATDAHAAYHPEEEEGAAPLAVRRIAVKLTNFFWPVAVRRGPDALRWGFSLITGSSTLVWLGHYIWRTIHGG